MTVRYLLDHISFDELVPHLLPMIWEPESLLYYMREEFDFIRFFDATADMDEPVRVSRCADGQLHVDGLRGLMWADAKGKEILYEGVYDVPLALVAAACLYEMVFYGYCGPGYFYQDESERVEYPDGPFYHKYVEFSEKVVCFQSYHVPKNGPKRRKLNRWLCRKDYLHAFARREGVVQELCKMFPKSQLQFLVLKMQYGYLYHYYSRLATGDERLDYILKSMTFYQKIDTSRYDGAFFWMTAPRNHAWSEHKWIEFQQDLQASLQLPIQFGIKWNERRREELMGDLLLYKRAQLPLYPKWNRGKFKEDLEEYDSFSLITHV